MWLYIVFFQDRYLLISMLFNYLVCIWHIIVSRFEDDSDTQGTMDLYAFIATVIIYIAYQLAFLIVVAVKVLIKINMFLKPLSIFLIFLMKN